MGSQSERTQGKAAAGGLGEAAGSHADGLVDWKEQLGSKIDLTTQGPSVEK